MNGITMTHEMQQSGSNTHQPVKAQEQRPAIATNGRLARRSFMQRLAVGGASLLPATMALADHGGRDDRRPDIGSITNSDADILRFLAAAEILETDLWQQYT